jgi:hypothetical protein
MKKLLIILPVFLLAFEVQFTKIYKKFVIPKKPAIYLITKDQTLTFPFHYVKTAKGYILYGNLTRINYWLENNFYAPKDAKFKNVKIAIIDTDKYQYQIIKSIKKEYKNCSIKNIIFLSPDETKIITKPQYIKLKYQIILNCQ